MKKLIVLLCILFLFSACGGPASQTTLPNGTDSAGASHVYLDASRAAAERVEDLLSKMSLADKAAQMVQAEQSAAAPSDMKRLGLGSVLSGGGSVPGANTPEGWRAAIQGYQRAALERQLKIPFIYGADAVHGHNTVYGAVIFPHNIGIGAANDAALTEKMGRLVAEEMKLTGVLWNFSPCVAVAQDPRWGRTYESYSSDPDIVCDLASAYFKGQRDAGVLATAKHYAGDGGTQFGTGEGSYYIDRGDVTISEDAFRRLHLEPYKRLVDEGIRCVMLSFSSFNGLKMHEHKYLITDVLKGEFGFTGFVVTDWEGVAGTSAPTYKAQVASCINAGVDMLMEPYRYREAIGAIIAGVESGEISEERVNDAVSRILSVKFEMGLFEDPYRENAKPAVDRLASDEARGVARELVQKSQVLLKNENNLLPFKRGQKVYLTGPAANDIGVQCGGWTLTWQGDKGEDFMTGTSILEGLRECAAEYGIEIITDEARAAEADVVLLAIGEKPYAEYVGDTADLSIIGSLALSGNADAIAHAQSLDKPVAALIVAGRNVLIGDYLDGWDAAVMCCLPGTEGGGVADVLTGKAPFTGKLPMPWYKAADDIGAQNPDLLFELGYGITTQ